MTSTQTTTCRRRQHALCIPRMRDRLIPSQSPSVPLFPLLDSRLPASMDDSTDPTESPPTRVLTFVEPRRIAERPQRGRVQSACNFPAPKAINIGRRGPKRRDGAEDAPPREKTPRQTETSRECPIRRDVEFGRENCHSGESEWAIGGKKESSNPGASLPPARRACNLPNQGHSVNFSMSSSSIALLRH